MGFGFKDSGGTGYGDSGVGYKASVGETGGPKLGFKESHGGTTQQGFGLKGFVPQESGGLKTKTSAPDPAEVAQRIAAEKEKSQKAFEALQREKDRDQKQWEQKKFEQQKQQEERQFEERKMQEQRAFEQQQWQQQNSQN